MSKLIVANWKSNKTIEEARQWLEEFQSVAITNGEVAIAPPLPFLPVMQWQMKNAPNISLVAQTISPFPAGAYTGAVSARNLEGLGVRYAIVGHSEQRHYFGFSSHVVGMQVEQCVLNKIIPIVCVDTPYLAEQVQAIQADQLSKCIVAYEPLEAIGTGNNAAVDDVRSMVERIKKLFGDVSVLYGGSVTPQNVGEYMLVCDGALVGTASLDATEFTELVQAALV